MAIQVDEAWLIDSFEYYSYEGMDDYGKPFYGEPKKVEKVRIDRSVLFSRDSTETKIVADGIIFCFASATTPFFEFKEQSKVDYDGRERIIKKVVPNYEPDTKTLWSVELEVL